MIKKIHRKLGMKKNIFNSIKNSYKNAPVNIYLLVKERLNAFHKMENNLEMSSVITMI